MSFRYPIKKGAENRVFTNCRRISDTIVESDEPLESIYLGPVIEQPAAPTLQPAPTVQAPITPVSQTAPQDTQDANKEASN